MVGRVHLALLLVLAGVCCAHRSSPCPAGAPAPVAAPQAPDVPDDEATVAAIEKLGLRYRPCAGGGRYLLDRSGAHALMSPDLEAVQTQLFRALPSHWANTAYLGHCDCPLDPREQRDPLCIVVAVRDGLVTAVTLAQVTADAARMGEAASARLQVEVHLIAAPGPRCGASDPACRPVPYHATCAEEVGYRPGARRVPVGGHRAGGACSHDGECDVAGCGNECVTTREPSGAGTCPYYRALEPALCGCVEGSCRWFTSGR